jgi:hypothetical protein
LANNLATMCLSDFGAMSVSWPQIGCRICNAKEGLKESQ